MTSMSDHQPPCFMCDPSILEGARCATGFPLCDTHREELTGNMNPALKRYQAEIERLRSSLDTLRSMVRIRRHKGEAWAVGFARPNWPKVAEIIGLPISFTERESACHCGRPLLFPGDTTPWCEGCTMSASTCDCAGAPV
jgi:hypothetical protein